jgi:hypothetical protein
VSHFLTGGVNIRAVMPSQVMQMSTTQVQAVAETYTPSTPSATWVYMHGLGRQPVVQVMINGEVVAADVTVSSTTVTVTFALPQTGVLLLT